MDNLVEGNAPDARLLEVAQVEPGTEAAPFAADNHGADFLVLLDRRKRGIEPLGHRAIDRVALFRTVERQRDIIVRAFNFDYFIGQHFISHRDLAFFQ